MEKGKDMMNEQREGSALFSIAIMVLTAVVWMSLDIYLPALPGIAGRVQCVSKLSESDSYGGDE